MGGRQEIPGLLLKLLINLMIAGAVVLLVISFKNPMLPERTMPCSEMWPGILELKTWNWYSLEESIFGLNTSRWMERWPGWS